MQKKIIEVKRDRCVFSCYANIHVNHSHWWTMWLKKNLRKSSVDICFSHLMPFFDMKMWKWVRSNYWEKHAIRFRTQTHFFFCFHLMSMIVDFFYVFIIRWMSIILCIYIQHMNIKLLAFVWSISTFKLASQTIFSNDHWLISLSYSFLLV